MEKKVERRFSRLELADYLAALSEQLRRGLLEAQGQVWTIPEEVNAKIHLKEEKGQVVAKMSWRWPASASYRRASGEAAAPGPTAWKAVKTRLNTCFKNLQRVSREGRFPDAGALTDLMESSRAFAALAQPEWQGALEEYLAHLKNLQCAVAQRQPEAMRLELENLKNRMAACHREFK